MNEDIVQKKHHYNILYSYYSSLLTEKQCQVFEYYFFDDFSLAEIASNLGISRNAVHDMLKNVQANLDEWEAKLNLYAKDQQLEQLLKEYEPEMNQKGKELIKKIREME